MSKDNKDLILCCHILSRIDSELSSGTREQLSIENLTRIKSYIIMAFKYIDLESEFFNTQIMQFNKCLEAIDVILNSDNMIGTSAEAKNYLVEILNPTITDFRVNVGRYLTNNEFEYEVNTSRVIESIIETCLDNGYYFGYN